MNTTSVRTVMAAAVLMAAGAAWGQAYVQQGRVLDANKRLGSGGLNPRGRVYDFGSGNRLMTGNVTGGRSFRGFSAIRDPSSLFLSNWSGAATSGETFRATGVPSDATLSLPSDRLSNFRRDSFGTSDLDQRRSLVSRPRPYYSPSSTVTNTGAIARGLNRPGTSQIPSPYMVPRSDLRPLPAALLPADRSRLSGTLLNVQPQLMRIDTGEPITGSVNPRLLNSPLFAGVRAIPLDALAAQARRDASLGAEVGMPVDLRISGQEPIDMRASLAAPERGPLGPVGSPLDRVLDESDGATWPVGRALDSVLDPSRRDVGGMQPVRLMTEAGDVFAGMRVASGPLLRPLKPEAGTEAGAPEAGPEDGPLEGRFAAGPSADEPLRTFVGTEESALNKYLADAEALLASGQYYKAASSFDLARGLDMRNPLPLLGRSMALLAAGDYMTSVNNLFQAIQLFESLGHFRIELTAFVPDLTVLDRRRGDLERRLEVFDDFRLRFLLGYAEYCSGMEELGLSNLEKAAKAAPEKLTSVRRFVDVLKRRTLGPTPPPGVRGSDGRER